MYKNTSILSYFRPFTQPPPLNKRSLPQDHLEEPRAFKQSRSTTPSDNQSRDGHDRERELLRHGLHQKPSRVTLRSSSRQPPDPKDANPYMPLTPLPNDEIPRDPDLLSLHRTSLTSNQRIVKHGEVVIRNSDDESDSDSSLEDLNHLLLLEDRRAQRGPSPPQPQVPAAASDRNADDGRRVSTRRRSKTLTVAAPSPLAPPVQPKKYKFDLELLARYKKQEEAAVEDITRASAMLKSLEQQTVTADGNAVAASRKGPIDPAFIDKALKVHGDEDEINRLKAAIQRTEALHHSRSWSFFDDQAREPLFEHLDFPIVGDDRLGRILSKTCSRQQAFLSGYVGEAAMKRNLPEDILLWIMDAICLESRDDLRYSYTATLTDASTHLASVLSPERIDMLFRKVGASTAALDIGGPVNPKPALSQSTEAVSRPHLLSILDLFHNLASILSTETRMHLICTLCRLVLDHSISNSCHIMSSVEDTFASLVESVPEQDLDHELQTIMTTVFKSITDASLRLRLLQNIPASSHRLILLRRRLALACFFRDIRYLSQHKDNTTALKSIARYLEGPQFIIGKATVYSELAAAIGILSIAVDCGDPPSSPCAIIEEKAFNCDIDALSLKLNSMFADIVDTGASHMGRTESKEMLEAFQYWLSYGVRTKHPPKKSLFGDSTLEGIASRHMMEAFVERGKQDTAFTVPDGVQRQGSQ